MKRLLPNRNWSMPVDNPPASGLADRFSLHSILFLSLLAYGIMAVWFPLMPNVSMIPPGDIRTFAPTLLGGLAYAALVVGLFALLMLGFQRAYREGAGARPLLFILLGATLLALPLLWSYPVNATDIFGYVIRGRIASAYGESPFSSPAAAFVGDPFMPLVGEWAGATTPYGPLWEIVATVLTAISGDSLLLGVLLFKCLALAAFLVTAGVIWQLLPEGRGRVAFTLLWAWNPGLLLTFVLDGHNDALMLMWLALGVWLGRRGRPAAGLGVMVLAALTKPVAVLALPFFILGFLHELPTSQARVRFGAISMGGALLLTWVAFIPWAGTGDLLRVPIDLALRLVQEATGGAGFSPAVWVYMILGQRVPIETIGATGRIIFAGMGLWLVWLGWRGRFSLRGVAEIFYGYVLTALNFRIWYAVWPFPWLLLDAGRLAVDGGDDGRRADYRLRVGFWFLLTSQLSVVLYGHARAFMLGGDQVMAHLIGVPFVFGLPWLLAMWPGWLSRPFHAA